MTAPMSKNQRKASRSDDDMIDREENCGEIWLQLLVSKQYHNGSGKREQETDLIIDTRLVNYRPAIAGNPPVSRLRRFVYLNSQRYLHAYVMWRFHDHCFKRLISLE
jgi:hypothetical protein